MCICVNFGISIQKRIIAMFLLTSSNELLGEMQNESLYSNHQQEAQNKRQQILKHNTIYIWRLKEVTTQDATNKQQKGWQLKK